MDPDPQRQPLRLTADDPLSPLSKWLAEARVDAAAAARARQRWLERQAAEESTIAGVLIDLAERAGPIAVRTGTGRNITGRVVAVGADFVAIRQARVGDVLVPQASITTVRAGPGEKPVVGDRPLALLVVLGEALVELAADSPTVLVATAGEQIRGELHRAGRDVISIVVEGQRREVIHVATTSIDHLVVIGR